MSYTIYHNDRDNIIEIVHLGTLTYQELEHSIPAAAKRCKMSQCWQILCDIRQSKYKLSNADEFSTIQIISEHFNPSSTISVLVQDEHISYEQIRLLHQSAEIHEINLKITNTIHDAVSWLNQ